MHCCVFFDDDDDDDDDDDGDDVSGYSVLVRHNQCSVEIHSVTSA